MRTLLDRLAALLALIVCMPLIATVALAVLVFLGRPVLFRQDRSGLGGRTFRLVKFRSMNDHRDATGALLPDHQRMPPFGALLRRSRLDELPELWNILRGDMAIVGPRPLLPATIQALGSQGLARGAVRPGITGLAQVSGNTLLDMPDKLAMDLFYIRRRTLRLDLAIMLRTPLMMMRGEQIDTVNLEKAYAGSRDRRS